MKIFTYQIFASVAETASFKKTAQQLHITPSAVSHAIASMENELGLPLLIRNRSEMVLSQAGNELLPMVERLLNEDRQIHARAAKIAGLAGGTLRIGAISSVCIAWLPTIIRHFKKQYPDVSITIVQGSFREIEQGVAQGRIDLGFSANQTGQHVDAHFLIDDEIKCLTPKDFVPKNGHSISQADLSGQHFILQRADYDSDTKVALDELDVKPQAINYSIDDQSILAMVEADLGWGILPDLALTRLSGEVSAYPFEKGYFRHLGLLTNSSAKNDPLVQAMKKEILNYIVEFQTKKASV
ncbi:LysR family transcriptional regulator [Fructobacillus sp. M158]|uniref:LysR family transcriptional regulator n=1 Tax=Fructobacillus parabroussonetiae TaxID=2713174 RepID=UPI00200AE1D7|nr:LysR family transcriptional regulator [Fructobacillus parabroussonetiae]MCK8617087.1 LysR family transcriptional regulator [Fructobacillus parabroussonetiae]